MLQWDDSWCVGVPLIDADHRLLVALANQLSEVREQRDGGEIVGYVLEVLVDYTIHHFRREERLMELASYPDLENHRRDHQILTAKVGGMKALWSAGNGAAAGQLADFLGEWLRGHILSVDNRYRPWVEKIGDAASALQEAAMTAAI